MTTATRNREKSAMRNKVFLVSFVSAVTLITLLAFIFFYCAPAHFTPMLPHLGRALNQWEEAVDIDKDLVFQVQGFSKPAFSPDAVMLAAVGEPNEIAVFSREGGTWKDIAVFSYSLKKVNGITWDASSRRILIRGREAAAVVDVATGDMENIPELRSATWLDGEHVMGVSLERDALQIVELGSRNRRAVPIQSAFAEPGDYVVVELTQKVGERAFCSVILLKSKKEMLCELDLSKGTLKEVDFAPDFLGLGFILDEAAEKLYFTETKDLIKGVMGAVPLVARSININKSDAKASQVGQGIIRVAKRPFVVLQSTTPDGLGIILSVNGKSYRVFSGVSSFDEYDFTPNGYFISRYLSNELQVNRQGGDTLEIWVLKGLE